MFTVDLHEHLKNGGCLSQRRVVQKIYSLRTDLA